MRRAIGLGHQHPDIFTHGLIGPPAEHACRRRTEIAYRSGLVDHDHGIGDSLEDRTQMGLAPRQRRGSLLGFDAGMLKPLAAQRNRERDHNERSEEHTSELQSLMRISYAVFCLKKKTTTPQI